MRIDSLAPVNQFARHWARCEHSGSSSSPDFRNLEAHTPSCHSTTDLSRTPRISCFICRLPLHWRFFSSSEERLNSRTALGVVSSSIPALAQDSMMHRKSQAGRLHNEDHRTVARQQLILILRACGSLPTRVRLRYSWLESVSRRCPIKHLCDTGDKGPLGFHSRGPAIR